jgi:hypothetical protein
MRAWSASHPLHAEVYERTRNEMEDRSSGRMRTLVTRVSKGRILLDLFTGGCHRRQRSFTSLRGKLFEGFVYFVDFLGTGVHVFHQFDLSLRASRAFVSNWVIAPMPGSLRIRWHKQGGEANDARSGPPLIGR